MSMLKCPFCGKNVQITESGNFRQYTCPDQDCMAHNDLWWDKAEWDYAEQRWNDRCYDMDEDEDLPFIAVLKGEEETCMIHDTCPECGGEIELSLAELMRCGLDDDRPRPTCKQCGRPVEIGHTQHLVDGEWIDE